MEVDDFATYGTPLEELEEDEVPKKKPMRPEDQVVTDEKGRRRFHGAFTGGFSAGYYNTVGSVEGWAPSTFQSSRINRSAVKKIHPEDYMDTEDLGEFGIAPRRIHTKKDFRDNNADTARKRNLPVHKDGPIPGIAPLHDLVKASSDTMGIKLLKKMGWKPGQGIGPKITRQQKKAQLKGKRTYSCSLPTDDDDDSNDDYGDKFLYAPVDVDQVQYTPKTNLQGLGYKGLDKEKSVLGTHFSLFDNERVKTQSGKKRIGMRGQAFGIGAFEDEDEDIYTHDDMSQYDFTLESGNASEKKSKEKPKVREMPHYEEVLEGFRYVQITVKKKQYPLPTLPRGYDPVHNPARPVPSTNRPDDNRGLNRHSMSALERGAILGEKQTGSVFDFISPENRARIEMAKKSIQATLETNTNKCVEIPIQESPQPIKTTVQNVSAAPVIPVEATSSTISTADEVQINTILTNQPSARGSFQPFASEPSKQKRYELYLTLLDKGRKDSFGVLQPSSMTEWEKSREREEFAKAARLYQPLSAGMASRFVTATHSHLEDPSSAPAIEVVKSESVKAAEEKKFGHLTHESIEWHPEKLLCKRFNVPDPYPESTVVGGLEPKKEKVSIFNFLNADPTASAIHSDSTKSLSQTLAIDADSSNAQAQPSNQGTNEIPKQPFKPAAIAHTKAMIPEIKGINPMDASERERPPIDIFKAIFADSESDDDKDEEKLENNSSPLPNTEKLNEKASSLTRKPQGIFANINFDELNRISSAKLAESETPKITVPPETKSYGPTAPPQDTELYGPKLPPPQQISAPSQSTSKHKKHKKKHKKEKHRHRSPHGNQEDELLKKLKKLPSRKY